MEPADAKVESSLEAFLATTFNRVRSKARTRQLHDAVLEEILGRSELNAELSWEHEFRLSPDGLQGTFDVDMHVTSEGRLRGGIVLVKALNSNIAKNIKNYANTTIGESVRCLRAPAASDDTCIERVVFVSLIPREAPVFDDSGRVKRFDDVVDAKSRTQLSDPLSSLFKERVVLVDVMYDIIDLRSRQSRADFATIKVENISGLDGLDLTQVLACLSSQ